MSSVFINVLNYEYTCLFLLKDMVYIYVILDLNSVLMKTHLLVKMLLFIEVCLLFCNPSYTFYHKRLRN